MEASYKRITRIAPLRAGFVIGAINGVARAILAVLAKTFITWAPHLGVSSNHDYLFLFLWGPAIYAGFGFVIGFMGAAIYNLTVKWTGGFVLEIQDVPSENR